MIIEDKILNEWDIYNADQFEKEFNISESRDDSECDEEYIMSYLEADERKFRVTFMESARDNSYEEFWRIQEV
jgi:hypothetical protein